MVCFAAHLKNITQIWNSSPIFGVKKNKQKIKTTTPQNGIFTNQTTNHPFSGHRLLSLVKRPSFHAPPWCTSARSAAACSWNWWSPNSLGIVVCRWWKRFVILNEMKKLQEIAVHWNEALEVIVCTIINYTFKYHAGKGNTIPSVLNCWTVQPFGSFGDWIFNKKMKRYEGPVFVHLRHSLLATPMVEVQFHNPQKHHKLTKKKKT